MSMIFFVDTKNNVLLHPDAISLCPELALLNDKEVLFIIYAFDYHSPFRQYPERQRLSKAIWQVFQDNPKGFLEPEERSTVLKNGIECYRGLQYDRNVELIEMYNRKIDELLIKLEQAETSSIIKGIRESIDGFRKDIKRIEMEVVESNLVEGQLKNNAKRSWIEKMQSNTKQYKSVIAKKG